MTELRFSDLSKLRKDFVRMCQKIGFGRIERLLVRASEPVFGPHTDVFIDVKLDSDQGPRPELQLSDFVLSAEVCSFLTMLDGMHSECIEHVEVRGGSPRRFTLKIPNSEQVNHGSLVE